MSDFDTMLTGEQIVWRGKPKFSVFILETIFNPMLLVAIVWGAFDFNFIRLFFNASQGNAKEMGGFLIPFFLLHLMPVWMYLGGVITSVIKYKHTEFAVTTRGIFVSGGILARTYEMKPFTDLSHVSIHRGILDSILGVGDVISVCNHASAINSSYGYSNNRNHNHVEKGLNICDIPDYQEVFTLIKRMQTDIYADTMYPNDLRPETNKGYNTRYDNF